MIFVVKFKGCMANASIFDIIIGKLRHTKKLCLVILFKINKSLKIDFYYIILPFSLTNRLWIKDNGESLLNAKEIV